MNSKDFEVQRLGECLFQSPMEGVCFTDDRERVLYHSHYPDLLPYIEEGTEPPGFVMAGPREKIYFDPPRFHAVSLPAAGCVPA